MAQFTAEDFFGKVTAEDEVKSLSFQAELLRKTIADSDKTAYTKEEVLELIRCTVGLAV